MLLSWPLICLNGVLNKIVLSVFNNFILDFNFLTISNNEKPINYIFISIEFLYEFE